jgi:hypothetical protein
MAYRLAYCMVVVVVVVVVVLPIEEAHEDEPSRRGEEAVY